MCILKKRFKIQSFQISFHISIIRLEKSFILSFIHIIYAIQMLIFMILFHLIVYLQLDLREAKSGKVLNDLWDIYVFAGRLHRQDCQTTAIGERELIK